MIELAKRTFPPLCHLQGCRVSHAQSEFSIRNDAKHNCDILGIEIDRIPDWPEGKRKCDGLFIIRFKEKNLIILVELKGGDSNHAITQIRSSVEVIKPVCHQKNKKTNSPKSHGHGVLGIIVGKRSLPIRQMEQSSLWKSNRIMLKMNSGSMKNQTPDQLFRMAEKLF